MPRYTQAEHRAKKLFSDKEFVGNVLRWATILEFWLECVLVQYFCRADRQKASLEMLMREVTFSRKIELLARLKIRRRVSSHLNAVRGLRRIRRLRNLVAHNWTLSLADVRNLLREPEMRSLLSGYPVAMQSDFRRTARLLGKLVTAREFRNPHSQEQIDIARLQLERVFD